MNRTNPKVDCYEAIQVEKAGVTLNYKKTTEFTMPEELQLK